MDMDAILDMLDSAQPVEVQAEGRRLARQVKYINVFLQPSAPDRSKSLWENCAMVLAERTDEELAPYLHPLLRWLADPSAPGSLRILERLKRYQEEQSFYAAFESCTEEAEALRDSLWQSNLTALRAARAPRSALRTDREADFLITRQNGTLLDEIDVQDSLLNSCASFLNFIQLTARLRKGGTEKLTILDFRNVRASDFPALVGDEIRIRRLAPFCPEEADALGVAIHLTSNAIFHITCQSVLVVQYRNVTQMAPTESAEEPAE